MANLYEILAEAQNGEAMAEIGRAYGLTQEQTDAAVAALLPAISMGLKRATETPEGLGNLFALMAQQPYLYASYNDPRAAFSPQALAAGNAALSQMFGSPDASRAIAAQAQNFSGVTSAILKKLLPVIVGMIISGLMRSGSGRAAPQAPAPAPAPDQGGGLIDILRQIFQQGGAETGGQPRSGSGSTSWASLPSATFSASLRKTWPTHRNQSRRPQGRASVQAPVPTDSGDGTVPGGDVLGQILRELEKGIREGRVKPVIVGPYEIDIPGTSKPAGPGQTQTPGGDILGQILREMLGGKGGKLQLPGQTSGLGSAVFGDRIETGRTSTRARSTACKRCSTASLARHVADVPSHSSRMEGVGIHFCRHKSHASRL